MTEMKNSDLNALLKEHCLELGIEWADGPGPAVIDGQKADEYFKDHTIFPDTKDIALVLEHSDGWEVIRDDRKEKET